ncbi:helix-turn-helix domain-containing protein [Nocardia vinacea]|uniref:Helix-turn-helix domain-containing protein n=1 Tax=Nocardia vinacea TaxID=96468 RepID=A0ABZ1YI28_9NOCA|nr:helix-turn-helix domain-containing protein [Nocardia vinacea]
MADKLSYNVEEAAEATGLHPRRIYDAINDNKLGYLQVGRAKIITAVELQRWLNSHQPGRP